jgi:peptidyl-prolyl cis-trans isomerase B (cyclophilin B)
MRKSNIIKKLSIMAIVTCSIIALVGCGAKEDTTKTDSTAKTEEVKQKEETPELVSVPQTEVVGSTEKLPIATITVKDYGTMEVELYPNIAPNTVNNFISLAKKGYYNGITFHRIIDKFMVQGGDPQGNGAGGPGYSIKGEFSANKIENKLLHKVGVISMARSQDVNSAGSQFFIMTSDAPHLDGNYAGFGRVIKGLDVLTKLSKVKTGANDKPTKDVVIESITIDTKGVEYKEPEKVN